MKLQVKPGAEYVLGGKVYRGGDIVDGVPDKFAAILTSAKGPLMQPGEIPLSPVDLPREVMARQVIAEEAPVAPEVNADAGEQKPKRSRYKRRDLQAEE